MSGTFYCATCHRETPDEDGASDEYPEDCAECAHIKHLEKELEAVKKERDAALSQWEQQAHELAHERNVSHKLAAQRDALREQLEEVKRERDEAQANYRWMVEHAADQKLDGYRELGARAAAAEAERDAALLDAAEQLEAVKRERDNLRAFVEAYDAYDKALTEKWRPNVSVAEICERLSAARAKLEER